MTALKTAPNNALLLFLQPALLLVLYSFQLFSASFQTYQVFLAFCFFQAATWSLWSKERFLFQLFMATTFAFNLALPILELLGLYDFPVNNLILRGDGITLALSQDSLLFAYKASIAAILGGTAGWLLGGASSTVSNNSSVKSFQTNRDSQNNIKAAFWVCFGLATSNALFLAYFALDYGYVSAMHGRDSSLSIPLLSILGDVFYKLSAVAYLWTSESARNFKRRSVWVLLPFFLQAIAGARGEFIIAALTIVVIYSYSYKSVRLGRAIFIASLFFLLAAFWGTFRFTRDFSDFQTIASLAEVLLFHFLGNSASIGVIGYTHQLQDQFTNDIPFLLGYIDGIFSFARNYSLEGIEEKSYLAQHITYHLNTDKLFGGSTIGTAYVAEVIEFSSYNLVFVFLISGLFLYAARFLVLRFQQSLFLYVVFFHYVEVMLLAPRGSFMKLFSKETFLYACVLLLLYVYKRLRLRRRPSCR